MFRMPSDNILYYAADAVNKPFGKFRLNRRLRGTWGAHIMRLAYPLLVLVGDVGFPVMDAVSDVGFVFKYGLHLSYRPCVGFFL